MADDPILIPFDETGQTENAAIIAEQSTLSSLLRLLLRHTTTTGLCTCQSVFTRQSTRRHREGRNADYVCLQFPIYCLPCTIEQTAVHSLCCGHGTSSVSIAAPLYRGKISGNAFVHNKPQAPQEETRRDCSRLHAAVRSTSLMLQLIVPGNCCSPKAHPLRWRHSSTSYIQHQQRGACIHGKASVKEGKTLLSSYVL